MGRRAVSPAISWRSRSRWKAAPRRAMKRRGHLGVAFFVADILPARPAHNRRILNHAIPAARVLRAEARDCAVATRRGACSAAQGSPVFDSGAGGEGEARSLGQGSR